MTVKTYYNRYIRNEIPNITFNDLAKFINIVLNMFDTMKLGYRQKKFAYATNNQIDIDNLSPQTEGGSSPSLVVFESLLNPYGYKMLQVTDYMDMFGEAGSNYYERLDNILKVIPQFDSVSGYGIKIEVSGNYNKISFYSGGNPTSVPSGFVTGHYVRLASDYTGLKLNYIKVVSVETDYILTEKFRDSIFDDPNNTYNWVFNPAYQVKGIYETTKLMINSSLATQTIAVKKELFELFNAMVFVEILSSGEYPNDRLLSIWLSKRNNMLGKTNG